MNTGLEAAFRQRVEADGGGGEPGGRGTLVPTEEIYQLLFNQVPCYISVQDRNLTILEYNRLFEEEFGEGLGQRCYQVYKKRADPCPVCPVAQSFADGQIHTSEELVTGRNGQKINTLVYSAPICRNGETVAVMEVSTNVTELRALQTHLTSLGQAIAGISHSMKGILAGLQGGVYIVNSGLKREDTARITQGWDIVQRNVDRISKLALDILHYAKARTPERSAVDLDHLAREVEALFRPKMITKGIAFSCELGPLGIIHGDPQWLHAMLVNLIENALDACLMDSREGRAHRIVFGGRRRGDRIALWVSDTGVGLDEEARKHAFDPTFSTKGSKGTGLGLMLAQKVATEHGGSVEVASTPGNGALFTVKLDAG